MKPKTKKVIVLGFSALFSLSFGTTYSITWNTSSDWDNAVSENGVVHESWGDHSKGAVELGWERYGSQNTLTGYWTFDENSGSTAKDVSGSSNDANIGGGVNIDDSGVLGTSSFYFSSGEVTVPSPVNELPTGDSAFTTVYWYKDNGATDNGGLVHWGSNSASQASGQEIRDDGWQHYFYSNDLNCYNIGLQDGNWHMLTVTFDPSTDSRKMYIDGNQKCSDDAGTVDISDTEIRIGNGDSSSQLSDAKIDELRIYSRALSGSKIQDLYNTVSKGKITTGWKNFTTEKDPNKLKLDNVSSTLNAQSVTVKVESDPDNDGTPEEKSSKISLNGSGGPYNLEGLTTKSRKYRLQINLSSSQVTTTPELSGLSLKTTGPAICDRRGNLGECISETTHNIDGQDINLNSKFEAKETAIFKAFTTQAQVTVSNTSTISGTWKGIFHITADEVKITTGAEFRPGNQRILLREN